MEQPASRVGPAGVLFGYPLSAFGVFKDSHFTVWLVQMRTLILRSSQIFVSLIISLWTVDVLVYLRTWEQFVTTGNPLWGALRDYVGLLVGEFQIALPVAFTTLLLTPLLVRWYRDVHWTNIALPLSASLLSGVSMFAAGVIIWSPLQVWHVPTSGESVLSFAQWIVPLPVMILTWTAVQSLMAKTKTSASRYTGEAGKRPVAHPTRASASMSSSPTRLPTMACLVYPATIVGLANLAMHQLGKGMWNAFIANFVTLVILLVLMAVVSRTRSRISMVFVAWLPVVLAIAMVFGSSFLVMFSGRATSRWEADDTKDRPSIILIVLDTVRADHLQRYGYERNTMPNLERWAQDATIYSRAVAAGGWTAPSHASIFSGLPVSLHGLHNTNLIDAPWTRARDDIRWLPARLNEKGYFCSAVTANGSALPPDMTGFHHYLFPRRRAWYGSTMAAWVDRYSPWMQRINERLRWRMPYWDAEQITKLARRGVPDVGGPVFLFINYLDAHSPYNPHDEALRQLELMPSRVFSRYAHAMELTLKWPTLPPEKVDSLMDLYDGGLADLDRELQHLFRWIDQRFGKEAIVIVTSDHGEELGEEGRVGHRYGLHQRILHVPLIIRSPYVNTGEVDDVVTLRSLYDFIIQCAAAEKSSGETLLLHDTFGVISERYAAKRHVKVFGSHHMRPWVSLIEKGYKAIGPSEDGIEFVDVGQRGFSQEVPVADDVHFHELGQKIDDYWEKYKDPREESSITDPLSEEVIERLRSVGYLQ